MASEAKISIEREVLNVQRFNELYPDRRATNDTKNLKAVCRQLKNCVKSPFKHPGVSIKAFFLRLLPILRWLPHYDIKECLVSDIISGITVGVMQIPQGMSYALLAGQHPVYGLYNAFFPVILYSILGTSRHVSMGTFAIPSLMLGTAMASLLPDPDAINGTVTGLSSELEAMKAFQDKRIVLGASTTFVVGCFLVLLSLMNLGSLVVYLSDPMISGFTCGAAVHVFMSQVKSLLGVKVGSYSGPLNIIWVQHHFMPAVLILKRCKVDARCTFHDKRGQTVVRKAHAAFWAFACGSFSLWKCIGVLRDVVLSLMSLEDREKTRTIATATTAVICVIFLLATKELSEKYKHKLPRGVPIPGEIIVVILGTSISYAVDLQSLYNVIIIGDIPRGLPTPSSDAIGEVSSTVGFAIPIAIVGYTLCVSIAKIFGNNFGYNISPNQELVAYGWSNVVVSFFYCIPAFPSMSRSCVQVDSGGKTQVVGFVSAFLILLVLLWIGPLFRTIPRACLASIIVVAIKGMLRKYKDFQPYWKTSKFDGIIWAVTCFSTILLDVMYGLAVGVGLALLCIVFRTQCIETHILSQVGNTEIYRKVTESTDRSEEFVIISFNGPLHYLNKSMLRSCLVNACQLDPTLVNARKKSTQTKEMITEANMKRSDDNSTLEKSCNIATGAINPSFEDSATQPSTCMSTYSNCEVPEELQSPASVKLIILDCTLMTFLDSAGVRQLSKDFDSFNKIGVQVVLTNVCGNAMQTLTTGGFIEKFSQEVIFLSIHDAVTWWRHGRLSSISTITATRL